MDIKDLWRGEGIKSECEYVKNGEWTRMKGENMWTRVNESDVNVSIEGVNKYEYKYKYKHKYVNTSINMWMKDGECVRIWI